MNTWQHKQSNIEYPPMDVLQSALALCILKTKDINRISSVAISKSGKYYAAGKIASDTKLLDISSEQAALSLSVQHNDFGVYKVITLIENPNDTPVVSPVVAKIIIDHSIRTGLPIEYQIIDTKQKTLFHTKNAQSVFPLYNPSVVVLTKAKTGDRPMSENKIILDENIDYTTILKHYATLGIERNFPTYDSASGYGAAIITKDNTLYFSGQYSGFDNNTGLHAEMTVVIRALMDRNAEITRLGLVSTKYSDTSCNMCGCCRQFVSEISNRFHHNPDIFCFAKDTSEYTHHTLNNYLPQLWTSKNW